MSVTHRFKTLIPSHRGVRGMTLAALAAGLLALPVLGAVHDRLVRSSPAAGDTLHAVPAELHLTFSRAMQLTGAEIKLTGPNGPVTLGTLAIAADNAATIVAPVTGTFVAGSHTIDWQILGTDGHPVRASFAFLIADDASGLAPATPAVDTKAPGTALEPDAVARQTDFDAQSLLYVVVRWAWFLSMLAVIGATAFGTLILARASLAPEVAAKASNGAARIGAIGAALSLATGIARLFAQTAAVQNVEPLQLITNTTWGTGWIIQIAASLLALTAFIMADRVKAGWIIAIFATAMLAVSPALSGHAMSAPLEPLPIIAHWIHVLAAGGWLGTLFVLLAAGIPATAAAPGDRARNARALVNAFSPTALGFAATLVITGAFVGWIHLGSLGAVFSSSYGRTLALKLAALAATAAFGAYNFLRVKPGMREESGVAALGRSARGELAFAVIVVLVTSVLVATPPPVDAPIPVASAAARQP